eukprot:994692-Ditylum_brightwellii.AAC.1
MKVESYYKNMLLSGEWISAHTKESIFLGNTHPSGLDPPCTSTNEVCTICSGKHSKTDCNKVKWYRKEVCCCPTQKIKKVQDNPVCYEKFINRKLHKYCEHCGCNKHGVPTKQEEKGYWNMSHHSNGHYFRPPTIGNPKANIATKPDTMEESLPMVVCLFCSKMPFSKRQWDN